MQKVISLLFTIFFILPNLSLAQQGAIKTWTFDTNDAEFKNIKGSLEASVITTGVEDMGYWMNGRSDYFIINESINLTDEFSVSFWFNPIYAGKKTGLIFQGKQNRAKQSFDSYIFVGIDEVGNLFINDEEGNDKNITTFLKNNNWYHITYACDKQSVRILLQGKQIWSMPAVDEYNNQNEYLDILQIGNDWGNYKKFEGVIDQITTFDIPVSSTQALMAYEAKFPKSMVEEPTLAFVDKSFDGSILAKGNTNKSPTPKEEKPKALAPSERNNEIQKVIYVNSLDAELIVWDFDEFDNDRITIQHLESSQQYTNQLLQIKKRKNKYPIKLNQYGSNTISFQATDMGDFDIQNTAGVLLRVGDTEMPLQLIMNEKKNAAIQLIYEAPEEVEPVVEVNKPAPQPIPGRLPTPTEQPKKEVIEKPIPSVVEVVEEKPNYADILEFAILDPIVVNKTEVILEIQGDKKQIGKKFKVLLDDKPVGQTYLMDGKTKRIKFDINQQEENVVRIEAFELEEGERFRANMRILNSGKEIVGYTMKLEKYNVMLPIAFVQKKKAEPKPESYAEVTVNDLELTIKVRDYSKVDGDIITIKQEGNIVLNEHYLTAEMHSFNVKLNPDTINSFDFVPVSMGKASSENTAWVQVIDSNGNIIKEFSLRSRGIQQKSSLKILHETK